MTDAESCWWDAVCASLVISYGIIVFAIAG